jgi:uncharacterized protein YjiS (DUF1127 family)
MKDYIAAETNRLCIGLAKLSSPSLLNGPSPQSRKGSLRQSALGVDFTLERLRSRLETIVGKVIEWKRRIEERRELMTLDDRMLHDIGLSRTDAEKEARKPFWKP